MDRFFSKYYLRLLYGLEEQENPEMIFKTLKNDADFNKKNIHISPQSCLMHDKLKAILKLVKLHNIHIIIYDDFKRDPKKVLQKTFKFLSVSPDENIKIEKVKKTMIANRGLIRNVFFVLIKINKILKYKLRIKSIKILNFLDCIRDIFYRCLCKRNPSVIRVPTDLVLELKQYFKEDVKRLSKLLKRDLMHWVN